MNRLVLVAPKVAIAVTLFTSVAFSQAPAVARDVDPNLVFQLLGTANTVEVQLPAAVKHVYVIGMHHDEVILQDYKEDLVPQAGGLDAIITAGALTDVNNCPLLAFVRIGLENEEGVEFARGHSTRCLELGSDPVIGPAPLPSPLKDFGHADMSLDTWLAMEGMSLRQADGIIERSDPSQALVFYVFLSTTDEAGRPASPDYRTWPEIGRAFH